MQFSNFSVKYTNIHQNDGKSLVLTPFMDEFISNSLKQTFKTSMNRKFSLRNLFLNCIYHFHNNTFAKKVNFF